jgi:hypothetical protein
MKPGRILAMLKKLEIIKENVYYDGDLIGWIAVWMGKNKDIVELILDKVSLDMRKEVPPNKRAAIVANKDEIRKEIEKMGFLINESK